MKEHPDYKYRPRRKPKALVKKEPKFSFNISGLMAPVPRLVTPLPQPVPQLPVPHHLLQDKPDLGRALFPPLPYPFYPFKIPSDDGKLAAELAHLQVLVLFCNVSMYNIHTRILCVYTCVLNEDKKRESMKLLLGTFNKKSYFVLLI